MKNLHIDMETNDPDDYMMLLYLLGHPDVHIVSITVYPGTRAQIDLIRKTVHLFEKGPIIGSSFNGDLGCYAREKYQSRQNPEISDIHRRFIDFNESDPSGDVIRSISFMGLFLNSMICGAPLTNITEYLQNRHSHHNEHKIDLYLQGGFVGDNVAPVKNKRFKGSKIWRTFNFGADINAADYVLSSNAFNTITCVSKNVTHSCVYTQQTHKDLAQHIHSGTPLEFMHRCMGIYLERRNKKKMHDVLAAILMLHPEYAEWKHVNMYHTMDRDHIKWGSYLTGNEDDIRVAVEYDDRLVYEALTGGIL